MLQSLPAAALPTTTPPPPPSRAGFFQLEPHSLYCKLWKLVSDAAAPARYLFPLFFPPRRPSGQESCRRDAAGAAEAGSTEGRTTQEPPARPKGAMSIRPEAPREEGDAGDRGREAELRGRARLSQQRRLRQATQFLHKDSADLLPLDGLKRLGTSKDWQPHSVIQRRLVVEGSPGRPQGEPPRAQAPIHGQESRTKTSKPKRSALLVNCKCRDQDLQVAVDTGTQYNQISAGCLSRLGLGKRVLKAPGGDLHPGPPALVEQLELQLGQETVECSAQVVVLHRPGASCAAAESPVLRVALPAFAPRARPVTTAAPDSPLGENSLPQEAKPWGMGHD
ncbi:nuclear receptor-interacting protein 2 isoform X1 [Bos mutus]|uniref:nuclear receptor-interacting protein 2 isoform X1 n=1 Tax=Bos mutus TaxID=72004 RepID=UPI0038B608AF